MPFCRLNKEYNQQGIYMSAATNNPANPRGKNDAEGVIAKTKEETKVGKTISFLDEKEEDIGYSFIIQPVKTSFAKFSTEIRKIIGGNSSQPAKTTEQNTKDQTEEQKKAQQAKDDVAKQNQVDKAFRNPEFAAKLITAESIKSSAYICLPLPTQIPRDQLSVSYSVEDLGAAVAGYTLGSEAADRVANGGSLSELGAAGGSYVIRSLLQEIAPKGVATAFFGNVPNPFAANIFENVDTRTFTFDWVFQPKSVEESRRLREIINQLRYYALPQPNGLLLELPHEFNLAFQGTDFLYAFSRCVLSNIEVSHAPNGFNVFTTADAPQSVALSLTFKEIFPLNKEVIMNFGNPSMTPQQLVVEAETQSPSPSSQTDASKETAVANSQQETENQINQQVADWKAKRADLTKLEQERDTILRSREPDPTRLANVNARITQTKVNMNLIATEVQSLQAKINYTTKSGKKLKPLPFV
jgi:hypothetical protein